MHETLETPASLHALTLLAVAALLPAAPVSAQTGGGESAAAPGPDAAQAYDECASPEVVFEEGSGPLTRAERIARMEQALHESLSRFERCQAAGGGAAGGREGGGVAGGGNGRDGESGEGATGAGSVATRSISGTESPAEAGAAGESGESASASGSVASRSVSGTEAASSGAEAVPETDAQPVSVTYAPDAADASTRPAPGALDNGKVPDDIPAADNDSVLEAQIRRAAMTETDPEIKAKLWNEYRAYKGLPQVPAGR